MVPIKTNTSGPFPKQKHHHQEYNAMKSDETFQIPNIQTSGVDLNHPLVRSEHHHNTQNTHTRNWCHTRSGCVALTPRLYSTTYVTPRHHQHARGITIYGHSVDTIHVEWNIWGLIFCLHGLIIDGKLRRLGQIYWLCYIIYPPRSVVSFSFVWLTSKEETKVCLSIKKQCQTPQKRYHWSGYAQPWRF